MTAPRRILRTSAAALAAACGVIAACSDFDETPPSGAAPAGDAAAEAVAETGGGSDANACVDVSSDPNHCGRCGHRCLGGTCTAGRCDPVLVGTSTDAPVATLAVDATRVYWMTSTDALSGKGSLYACTKGGCPSGPQVLAENEQTGTVASDGVDTYASFIYGFGRVARVDPTGTLATLSSFDGYHSVFFILPRPGEIYLNEFSGTDAGPFARTVLRWDGGPGAPEVLGTYASPASPVVNLMQTARTDQHLYLAAINLARIETCSLPSCASFGAFVATNEGAGVEQMVADGKRVYWVINGRIDSCADGPTCAQRRTELASAQLGGGRARLVAVGGGRLYTGTDQGDLFECDVTSCASTARVLVSGVAFDLARSNAGARIALDDAAVYYATVDTGTTRRIMRIAK